MSKSFYVVTSLTQTRIGDRNRYDTKEEALNRAREVLSMRSCEGRDPMTFYILKAIAIVEPAISKFV